MKKNLKSYPVKEIIINYKKKPIYDFFKRLFDIFVSFFAIIILMPVFLIFAILIKVTSKGPVLYKSIRYTKDGKPFTFLKFRSMVVDAESKLEELIDLDSGQSDGVRLKIKNDPRITKVGRLIRRTSIDELPQLFNVLVGDMSIVGPRPAIEREVLKYDVKESQRMLVKGGLTCIWQCSGRSNISFKEQINMDIKYIENRGFWYDILLILKTIPAVICRKGAA